MNVSRRKYVTTVKRKRIHCGKAIESNVARAKGLTERETKANPKSKEYSMTPRVELMVGDMYDVGSTSRGSRSLVHEEEV